MRSAARSKGCGCGGRLGGRADGARRRGPSPPRIQAIARRPAAPGRSARAADRLREPGTRSARKPVRTRRAGAGEGTDLVRFSRYQHALERNGVDLLQIGHGPERKNGADIRMAVDAMETLIVHPEVEAFVLVSGDSDFSALVSKLREFGKHVIGVGAETAVSARLVSVCSEYKLWGSIVARVDPPDETTTAPAQPGFRLADGEALIASAMEQIATSTPTASQVKAKMLTLDPVFRRGGLRLSQLPGFPGSAIPRSADRRTIRTRRHPQPDRRHPGRPPQSIAANPGKPTSHDAGKNAASSAAQWWG